MSIMNYIYETKKKIKSKTMLVIGENNTCLKVEFLNSGWFR